MTLEMISRPSPNFNDRPDGTKITSIIIHYTGMKTAEAALNRLCDPESKVSAHYTIDVDGTIYTHVAEDKRAWHAGKSEWGTFKNFNDFSIGIELVNRGHDWGYHPFPDRQIDKLITLLKDIYTRHPIDPSQVLGHEVIAPDRKRDPGELFPWDRLIAAKLTVRTN